MNTYKLPVEDYKQLVYECIYLLKAWHYGDGKLITKKEGICHNLWRMTSINAPTPFKDHVMYLMTKWENFSGDDLFPVPPTPDLRVVDPMDAYLYVYDEWAGEYGKMRRDLCLDLAKRLEEELKCN